MKKKYIHILIMSLILVGISGSIYAYEIPDKIRVGIYAYNDQASESYRSLKNISIMNNTGFIVYEVGTSETTVQPKEIFRVPAGKGITIERYGSYNGKNTVKVYGNGNEAIVGDSTYKYLRIEQIQTGDPILYITQRTSYNSDTPKNIAYNNSFFMRGSIEIRRFSRSDFTFINYLSMQDYLKGVVPAEIGTSSSMESLKSQAVTARTYAMYNINKRSEIGCNIIRTTEDQAYLGYSSLYGRTDQAVNETNNQILTVNGKPFSTMYSAINGKYTEKPSEMYTGGNDSGFGNNPDSYDNGRYFEETITADQIRNRASSYYGFDPGVVKDIVVTRRSVSGKIIDFNIVGTNGTFSVPSRYKGGFSIRRFFWVMLDSSESKINTSWGTPISIERVATKLPAKTEDTQKDAIINQSQVVTEANAFDPFSSIGIITGKNSITIKGADKTVNQGIESSDKYIIKGYANSHSCGMSQTGSQNRGRAGFTYAQILNFYYSGAVLENAGSAVYGPYKDVPLGMWYTPYIQIAKDRGWVSGDTNGNFGVGKVVTRAEAATIATKVEGLNVSDVTNSGFNDANSHWSKQYIGKLNSLGFYKEFNYGSNISPDKGMTREELFTLYNHLSMNATDKGIQNNFADKDKINSNYLSAINNLVSRGIISGDDMNRLNPTGDITKEQVIVIACKIKGLA